MTIGERLEVIGRDLGDVRASLATVVEWTRNAEKHREDDRRAAEQLAGRVTALERWKWAMVGAAAAGGSLAGPVVSAVSQAVGG